MVRDSRERLGSTASVILRIFIPYPTSTERLINEAQQGALLEHLQARHEGRLSSALLRSIYTAMSNLISITATGLRLALATKRAQRWQLRVLLESG